MKLIFNKNHKKITELVSGKSSNAIYLTVVGKNFQKLFKKYCLKYFKSYCKKYDLGLIVLNDLLIDKKNLIEPFNYRLNLQRLLMPGEIKRLFPKYKYLADIDADCLPSLIARNIFDFTNFKNINEKNVYLTHPWPTNYNSENLGRRMSLLRRKYLDKKFPLNSILSGGDENEKRIYNLKFNGPIATIGTCIATTNFLTKCYDKIISKIIRNPGNAIYLQHQTNKIFRMEGKVNWLPYEFQAIWSYEVALYYPFLIKNLNNHKLFNSCIKATLSRVDMLHFAGSWPENKVFKDKILMDKYESIKTYHKEVAKILKKKIKIKSYGKINYKK